MLVIFVRQKCVGEFSISIYMSGAHLLFIWLFRKQSTFVFYGIQQLLGKSRKTTISLFLKLYRSDEVKRFFIMMFLHFNLGITNFLGKNESRVLLDIQKNSAFGNWTFFTLIEQSYSIQEFYFAKFVATFISKLKNCHRCRITYLSSRSPACWSLDSFIKSINNLEKSFFYMFLEQTDFLPLI